MECREAIGVFVAKVKEMEQEQSDELAEIDISLFKTIVRIMIEGEIWEDGAYLMDLAVGYNKLDLEAGYLHAFCLFNAQKDIEAMDICEDLKERGILKYDDEELVIGFKELYKAVSDSVADKEPEDEDWEDESDEE